MKKRQIENSQKSKISEISEKLFRVFLFPGFWNSDLKVLEKNFRDFRVSNFSTWPTEAVTQRCSVKKVFLEISQNGQENTCARVSFSIKLQIEATQVFSCKFCKISKNTFSYRTSTVATSVNKIFQNSK